MDERPVEHKQTDFPHETLGVKKVWIFVWWNCWYFWIMFTQFPRNSRGITEIEPVFLNQPSWVFPKIGVSQNGWFIMENPIKIGWFGGKTPYFWKHPSFGGRKSQTPKFLRKLCRGHWFLFHGEKNMAGNFGELFEERGKCQVINDNELKTRVFFSEGVCSCSSYMLNISWCCFFTKKEEKLQGNLESSKKLMERKIYWCQTFGSAMSRYPPRKLAWQWNIHHFKMYFLLKKIVLSNVMLVFRLL